MNDKFKRILDLAKRTGDTMIVTDPNADDVFVVMDIDQYEMLMGVGHELDYYPEEEVLFDASREDHDLLESDQLVDHQTTEREPDIWETMAKAGESSETWDVSKMSEQEILDLEKQYRDFTNQGVEEEIGKISSPEVPEFEEEKPKNEEDFGEEQFYLEPVE